LRNYISRLCGKINPLSIKEYKYNGGFKALEKVLFSMSPTEVINLIKASNLKGRGGASFPTGLKWQLVASEKADEKYIICNADEGEPGTFKDKVLIDGCPLQILEGMIIAAYTVGASRGYVYIRGEYSKSAEILKKAIDLLNSEGYLGSNILGNDFSFDIEIRTGAGAYICGEETALIESIEGNPGRSRFKPPYPTTSGLWGKPTLVNNVETLVNIPAIITAGPERFKLFGTESSSGTKLISVCGSVVSPGVFEVEFGTSIKEIIFDICGGIEGNKKLKFIQLGGSSGPCLPEELLDLKLDYSELKQLGYGLGSGALLIVDESVCVVDFVKNALEFFKHESCGKCTPCREGIKHLINIFNRITRGQGSEDDLDLMLNLSTLMNKASLCSLGQAAPTVIFSTLKYFKEEYIEHINGCCRTRSCFKGEVM
jgi:NADH-quinone oxidoreductase subunit F